MSWRNYSTDFFWNFLNNGAKKKPILISVRRQGHCRSRWRTQWRKFSWDLVLLLSCVCRFVFAMREGEREIIGDVFREKWKDRWKKKNARAHTQTHTQTQNLSSLSLSLISLSLSLSLSNLAFFGVGFTAGGSNFAGAVFGTFSDEFQNVKQKFFWQFFWRTFFRFNFRCASVVRGKYLHRTVGVCVCARDRERLNHSKIKFKNQIQI